MPRSTLLLLAATATANAYRLPQQQRGRTTDVRATDGYSKYEGKALLRLEACTAAAARGASASAIAEGCRVFQEERFAPPPGGDDVSQCGEVHVVFTICGKVAAAGWLGEGRGVQVRVLSLDAGTYLRGYSGVPAAHPELDASSLAEGAQDTGFYADWQGPQAREARIEAAVTASGGIAQIESAGSSLQGRPIKLVRFTGKGYKPGMAKVVISYQVLAPLVNPDGFEHTLKEDRYHRKNMRPTASNMSKGSGDPSSCDDGVDLNRNAPIGWDADGESHYSPCEEVFHGGASMSEPETQAMAKLFKEAPMSVYLDIHSYSQFILSSWLHTTDDPPRKKEFDDLGARLKAAIVGRHNATYEYGQGSKLLYEAGGCLADYATSLGALGFVIELRPTDLNQLGVAGFAPEKEAILPAAEECYEGALAAIQYAKEMPAPTGEQKAEVAAKK